ncbi:hypothetical protein [Lysinibacillus fusiformis]|uniref:hypothetical protein n=1 Tax=Lysinibacillus fusiformis TaxID=28031 RepID=UPI0020BDA5B9|nr:hypothetical protein [Lysinibacillus fusiformis]
MKNEYKYHVELNNEKLGVFNSYEKARQCVEYLVKKFFDKNLKGYSNEGAVRLDITPFYSGSNRGDRVLTGKNYSSEYSVKQEFKEKFKVEYQKTLIDLKKEIRLMQ